VAADRPALGIAIKIGDGDGKRGVHPAVIETLRQMGVLDAAELRALQNFHTWKITNHRGTEVGEVRANFALTRDQVTSQGETSPGTSSR